jgi:hydroxypyruvate reductase
MPEKKGLIERMAEEAREIFMAAVNRVDPYEAVNRFLRRESDRLLLRENGRDILELDLNAYENIYLVGAGKATAPMARAMEALLGDRLTGGMINVKYGFSEKLGVTEITEADHPLPDQNGVEGTEKILRLLHDATADDLIFSLISGGGSALLPQPVAGVTLEEKQALTKDLLGCGASIDEINAIRKHISASKGGQLATSAYPALIVNLMLSDVVGDRMDVIASGPFVPDESTFEQVWVILERYGLLEDIAGSIREHLEAGRKGTIPETPKEGAPVFNKVHNFIIGSNILALEAAAVEAEKSGYRSIILSSMVEGETREVAGVHTAIAKEILKTGRPFSPPACIITGGETTVTIKGNGLGGRNQEFALAASMDIEQLEPRVVILSGGTDGNDGPTPAAGAWASPLTVKLGREKGLEALKYLDNNDAYHFFEEIGGLLMTGPTKTNVMDVRLILIR